MTGEELGRNFEHVQRMQGWQVRPQDKLHTFCRMVLPWSKVFWELEIS
jgi:hypothetical protein